MDTTHIQREEASRERDMDQRIEGEVWGDGKMILLQIWSLKHLSVKEWMLNASAHFLTQSMGHQ